MIMDSSKKMEDGWFHVRNLTGLILINNKWKGYHCHLSTFYLNSTLVLRFETSLRYNG